MTTWTFTRVLMLCCFSTVIAQAQTDFRNFSLDSFKLPDIDRKALTGSGSLFAHFRELNHESFPNSSSQSFRPNLRLDYDRLINNQELQSYRSINFDQRFSTSDFNSSNYESTGTIASTSLFYSGTRRHYKNRSFFETSISGD